MLCLHGDLPMTSCLFKPKVRLTDKRMVRVAVAVIANTFTSGGSKRFTFPID